MNADSFDQLSRRMGAAGSRRGLLRAFVGGVAAAVAGSLVHTSDTRAQHTCSSDVQCGVAQRCLSGACVADSHPAALTGRPPSGVTPCSPPYCGCGEQNQECCSPDCGGRSPCIDGCLNGLTCNSGTCGPCGGLGQRCCPGSNSCSGSTFCNADGYCQFCTPGFGCGNTCCSLVEKCENGVCSPCGVLGKLCCPGNNPPCPGFCDSGGICQYCYPQAKCGTSCCALNEACINNVCMVPPPCGDVGQPCCMGDTCGSFAFCNSQGTCQFCFNTHICGRTCCGPLEVCRNGACTSECGTLGQRCCPGNVCSAGQEFCNSDGYCQFCLPTHKCGNTCCGPFQTCTNGVCA